MINLFIFENETHFIERLTDVFNQNENLGVKVVGYENSLSQINRDLIKPDVFIISSLLFIEDKEIISHIKNQFPYSKIIITLTKETKHLATNFSKNDSISSILKPFKFKQLLELILSFFEGNEEKEDKKMEFDQKFKALSDPTRRKILDLLKEKILTAGEIADICQATKPNISQHLNVLKNAKLIKEEKKGLYVYYSLNKQDFIPINREVKGMISIKDKILSDIAQIAENKKCEPVSGATDSQDEGTVYIMKDSATILSFDYSFRLSSFTIRFEIPAMIEQLQIDYQDTLAIEEFLQLIEKTLDNNLKLLEIKEREKNESASFLSTFLANKTSGMNLFGCKSKETINQLREWCLEAFKINNSSLPLHEQKMLIEEIILEITSLGKIHPLLEDPTVSEIMINSYDEVAVERKGKLEITNIKFKDNEEVLDLARRIVSHLGRRIDNSNPIVDARLPDGSRISIIIPPMSVRGVTITIRKFFQEKLIMNDLINFGTISKEASDFLEAAVKARANIIVAGGTGSGKTTFLNILTNFTPTDERVFTIEDSLELDFHRPHAVNLESRPANSEGRGEITIRDLIKFSLHSRPERIVVGELRDGSMFDFLQACNTGHDGSMASTHGVNMEATKSRMMNLMQQVGFELPEQFLGDMIADGLNLIVQIARMKDGSRKVVGISEVNYYDKDTSHLVTTPIFEWVTEGIKDGKISGNLYYTGHNLSEELLDKFEKHNIEIHELLDNIPTSSLKKEEIEVQLPDTMLCLADALKAGHIIKDAIKIVGKELEGVLGNEFLTTYHELESGLNFTEGLKNLQERVNHPDFDFFVHALLIQYETGGKLEPVLRHLIDIMEDNSMIRKTIPFYKSKSLFSSKSWQLIEFVELLATITPSSKNLADAISKVCNVLKSDIAKEFLIVSNEINAGRKTRDALKDAAKRLDMIEVNSLVSQINQAETFGTGVEKTLKVQADKLRKTFKLIHKINF